MLYQNNEKQFNLNSQKFEDALNCSNEKRRPCKIRSMSLKSDNSTQIQQKGFNIQRNSYIEYSNTKEYLNQQKTEIQIKINILKEKIQQHPKTNLQKELQIVLAKKELMEKLIYDFTSNFDEKIQLEKSQWEIKQCINNYKKQLQFFNTGKNNKKKISLQNQIQENLELSDEIQKSLNINQTQKEFFESFLQQIPQYLQLQSYQQQMNQYYVELEALNIQNEYQKAQNCIKKQNQQIEQLQSELFQKNAIINCFIKLTNKKKQFSQLFQDQQKNDDAFENSLFNNKPLNFSNFINSNKNKDSSYFSFIKSPINENKVKKKFSLDHSRLQNFNLKINQKSNSEIEEQSIKETQQKSDCINVSKLISKNQKKTKPIQINEETINVSNTLRGKKERVSQDSKYEKYKNEEMENFLCTEENEKITDSILQTPVQNDTLQNIESPEKIINDQSQDQIFFKRRQTFPRMDQDLFCSIDNE